ncbi:MAG: hypothetical protein JJE30_06020 [Desulfuromonadales bacterium]|nr:hypothetical protein [Desulfuromonadales bacterium]
MKHTNKLPNVEQQMMIEAISRLNYISDELREIQQAAIFLGTVSTDPENEYSDDLMVGAAVCFEMLDERFGRVIGVVEKLTSEVKTYEVHMQTH